MKPLEAAVDKRSVLVAAEPMGTPQKTVVVLGVERGGTSMVAGVLRAMGINLGDKAGRNHEDPKFLSDDPEFLQKQILINNTKSELWGFKIPKAALQLDFYNKYLRNPHYVLVFRNLSAIADSWHSREGSDYVETIQHALSYYGEAVQKITDAGKPLLLVNYERACDMKDEFITAIADFIGIEMNEETVKRAASVITGDGGGYVDIPDYYFHISALKQDARLGSDYAAAIDPSTQAFSEYGKKLVTDKLVLLPDGNYFPESVYVEFDLEAEKQVLIEDGIRIYLDFKGDMFPGHAFRPPLQNGKNVIWCHNNGKVKRLAFGPLRRGLKYGIRNIRCYTTADNPQEYQKRGDLISMLKRIVRPYYRKVRSHFDDPFLD